MHKSCITRGKGALYPTNAFTILEPQDQEIGELYAVPECRVTDFEAAIL